MKYKTEEIETTKKILLDLIRNGCNGKQCCECPLNDGDLHDICDMIDA